MKRNDPWSLWMDSWSLALEASSVIGMRLGRMATMDGPSAAAEMRLMVSEKVGSAIDLQGKAITGRLGATSNAQARLTIAHYRKAVAKNRRRLSGPKKRA